jgi:dolichol-phosphate mannosyltransferase
MDADLQHPVDKVLDLVAAGEKHKADLVVATRYADGGDRGGLSGGYRKLVSGSSTLVTKLAFRGALAQVSDPMSGFFAVRTATLDVTSLRPLGYKILLELVVRTRPARVAEVPYTFAPRYAGESKSSVKEGLRFLRHLAILRLGATRARMIGIGLIGASGVLPNLAALAALTSLAHMHYLPAAVLANQVAIAWNFLLTDGLLFKSGQRRRSFAGRALRYLLLGNADLVLRIPALALLVTQLHLGALVGNAITLAGAFLLRFLVIDRVIYARTSPSSAAQTTPPQTPAPQPGAPVATGSPVLETS